jgi:FkbM family methyltransferase
MYYGQFETDKYIEKYFPNKSNGVAIEVGAYDGIKGSNTKYFEDAGWKCICIEPNPLVFEDLSKNRKTCINCACSSPDKSTDILRIFTLKSGIQSSLTSLHPDQRLINDYGKDITNIALMPVQCITLDSIISSIGQFIDFISIDTEGTELDVLQGLDLTIHRPSLLVIENNYEDPEIEFYMNKYGYKLNERYKINDFYIPA